MPAQSGLAAGAQAGAAFGPWGAAIGGAAGLVSDIANAPTGPMLSGGMTDSRSSMDGSGWTVSTGSSKAAGGARTGGTDMSGTPSSGSSYGMLGLGSDQAGFGGIGMLVMVGLIAYFLANGGKL